MKKAAVAAMALLCAAAFIAGCVTSSIEVDYIRSSRNPVLAYQKSQALPPPYNQTGPTLIVYGDGTSYRLAAFMDLQRGRFADDELKALLTSIVDKGFFDLPRTGEPGPPGGITETVTVTLKERSSAVSGSETEGGAFREIVDEIEGAKPADETECLPQQIVFFATPHAGGVPDGARVVDWTLSVEPLEDAASSDADSAAVSTPAAEQVWELLKEAYGSTGDTEVYWRAGDRLYTDVYAVPQFPAPGV